MDLKLSDVVAVRYMINPVIPNVCNFHTSTTHDTFNHLIPLPKDDPKEKFGRVYVLYTSLLLTYLSTTSTSNPVFSNAFFFSVLFSKVSYDKSDVHVHVNIIIIFSITVGEDL